MTTYLQEMLISSEPITTYMVEMRGERVEIETEEGTNVVDDRMLVMVYDGNFFTLTQAQIELERDFAIQNNAEDRLNELITYFAVEV